MFSISTVVLEEETWPCHFKERSPLSVAGQFSAGNAIPMPMSSAALEVKRLPRGSSVAKVYLSPPSTLSPKSTLASLSPLWQQPPVSGYPCHPKFPAFTCSMTSNANTNDLTQCAYRWENVGQKRHCASVLLCTPVCLCFCLFCLSLCLSLCQPCSHHSRLRLEMKPSANPAENQQVNSPVPGTPSRTVVQLDSLTVASWRTLT